MAHFYRLSVLFIALLMAHTVLAIPNDNEPGKSVPPKGRISRPIIPPVRPMSGLPLKLSGVSPLPWSRLISPAVADPIRFMMRASKDSVALGEEFEITITAQLLDISPQSMFFFEEQKAFSLKVLMPDGFQQTGGDYYDYIGADFRQGGNTNTSVTYRVRGLLTKLSSKATFTLLRGPKDGSATSLFEKKQEVHVRAIRVIDPSSKARQPAVSDTSCQLINQSVRILQGPTINGLTSLTILVQNALPSYRYRADSLSFSLTNVVSTNKNKGFIYIQDSKSSTCYRKVPYVLTSGQNSSGVPQSLEGDCSSDGVYITPWEATICDVTTAIPNNPQARVATSSVTLSTTSCASHIVWYRNGNPISGENDSSLTVYVAGTYTLSCKSKRCPSNTYTSNEAHISGCPNPCTSQSTDANWVDTGFWRCANDTLEILVQDINPCSPTHGLKWRAFFTGPHWDWLDEYQCDGTTRQRKQRDFNGCTNLGDKWVNWATCSGDCEASTEPDWRWKADSPENYQCSGTTRQRKQYDANPCTHLEDQWATWATCSGDCGASTEPDWRWKADSPENYQCSGTTRQRKQYDANPCTHLEDQWATWATCSGDCGASTEPDWRWKADSPENYQCSGTTRQRKQYDANPCTHLEDQWATWATCSGDCGGAPNAPQLSARLAGTSSTQSLTLTASGCPTGTTIHWYGPNGTTATSDTWIITNFSQTTEYSAKCVTIADNNCASDATPITVTRKNPSAPMIQTTATLLCAGQSVTLTAGCSTGTPLWSTGQTGSPLILTPTATASYYARCLDGEVVSDGQSTSVQITLANSLTVNGRTDYVIGETISLTAISSVQSSTYTWKGPAGFTQTGSVLQIIGAGVSQAGDYTVVASSGQGCAGQKTVHISVTDISFPCTCQDCDNLEVKETTNPNNSIASARNRGSVGQNFVSESVYMDANGGSVSQTISYFDGLGRLSQKVSVGTTGGSSAGDLIAPMVYDAFGREPVKYLPFAASTSSGDYRPSAAGSVSGYYAGLPDKTGNAFTTISYEKSPLNRVLFQTAPGSNIPVRINYRTNAAGELPLLTYDFSAHTVGVSSYGAGQLYVTETTDENGAKTIEYKDKEGRVVGKDVSGLKTLYSYDDFGLLRCVVPPKAVGIMGSGFDPFTANDLLFAYDYDARGRMTRKKVPGAGVTTMTYNERDLLISSTDANGITIITDYDALDRVVATKQGGTTLTQTFYDGSNLSSGNDAAHPFASSRSYGQTRKTDHFQGMVTGSWTAQLEGGNPLVSAIYYDDLGRVIQTVSNNHKGGLDYASSQLDYIGRVADSQLSTTNSNTTITVNTRTRYDAGSRIKSICQQVADNLQTPESNLTLAYWEPVARNSYNGIGELTRKTLGCGIQNIDYTYQMRGWLSKMNDPAELNVGFLPADKRFFGMKLTYDPVGNISQWDYRNAQINYGPPSDLTQRPAYQYGFTYDALNRLTSGTLNQQGQTKFSLNNMSYDPNGNIMTMIRSMGSASDEMGYSYGANSNRLMSLSSSQGLNWAKTTSYTYDPAGNLWTDQAKGITSNITYNYLNLPKKVVYSGGEVNYSYSASGQKLSASFPAGSGSVAKTYDYVAGLVYANNALEFIPTAEGRVLPPGLAFTTVKLGNTNIVASNAFYRYEYQLKDHLGNLRVACRCGEKPIESSPNDTYQPLVVQEQHYDPFGLDLPGLGVQPDKTTSRFKYNGKEEQTGLGWINFGARLYDPVVPRWLQVDPLSELDFNQSGYMYVSGNPINRVDLFGMTDTTYVIKPGTTSNTLDAVTVTARRNNPLNNSIAENWAIAYTRNKAKYGEASPYRKDFQAGGNMAAVVAVAPLAGMAIAEGAATVSAARYYWKGLSQIQQLARLRMARAALRKALIKGTIKGGINLFGQSATALTKGESITNIDILGLSADILLPTIAGAAVGGIGEYKIDDGFKPYPVGVGLGKFATGLGFSMIGGSAQSYFGPNAYSDVTIDGVLKLYNEAANLIIVDGANEGYPSFKNPENK